MILTLILMLGLEQRGEGAEEDLGAENRARILQTNLNNNMYNVPTTYNTYRRHKVSLRKNVSSTKSIGEKTYQSM